MGVAGSTKTATHWLAASALCALFGAEASTVVEVPDVWGAWREWGRQKMEPWERRWAHLAAIEGLGRAVAAGAHLRGPGGGVDRKVWREAHVELGVPGPGPREEELTFTERDDAVFEMLKRLRSQYWANRQRIEEWKGEGEPSVWWEWLMGVAGSTKTATHWLAASALCALFGAEASTVVEVPELDVVPERRSEPVPHGEEAQEEQYQRTPGPEEMYEPGWPEAREAYLNVLDQAWQLAGGEGVSPLWPAEHREVEEVSAAWKAAVYFTRTVHFADQIGFHKLLDAAAGTLDKTLQYPSTQGRAVHPDVRARRQREQQEQRERFPVVTRQIIALRTLIRRNEARTGEDPDQAARTRAETQQAHRRIAELDPTGVYSDALLLEDEEYLQRVAQGTFSPINVEDTQRSVQQAVEDLAELQAQLIQVRSRPASPATGAEAAALTTEITNQKHRLDQLYGDLGFALNNPADPFNKDRTASTDEPGTALAAPITVRDTRDRITLTVQKLTVLQDRLAHPTSPDDLREAVQQLTHTETELASLYDDLRIAAANPHDPYNATPFTTGGTRSIPTLLQPQPAPPVTEAVVEPGEADVRPASSGPAQAGTSAVPRAVGCLPVGAGVGLSTGSPAAALGAYTLCILGKAEAAPRSPLIPTKPLSPDEIEALSLNSIPNETVRHPSGFEYKVYYAHPNAVFADVANINNLREAYAASSATQLKNELGADFDECRREFMKQSKLSDADMLDLIKDYLRIFSATRKGGSEKQKKLLEFIETEKVADTADVNREWSKREFHTNEYPAAPQNPKGEEVGLVVISTTKGLDVNAPQPGGPYSGKALRLAESLDRLSGSFGKAFVLPSSPFLADTGYGTGSYLQKSPRQMLFGEIAGKPFVATPPELVFHEFGHVRTNALGNDLPPLKDPVTVDLSGKTYEIKSNINELRTHGNPQVLESAYGPGKSLEDIQEELFNTELKDKWVAIEKNIGEKLKTAEEELVAVQGDPGKEKNAKQRVSLLKAQERVHDLKRVQEIVRHRIADPSYKEIHAITDWNSVKNRHHRLLYSMYDDADYAIGASLHPGRLPGTVAQPNVLADWVVGQLEAGASDNDIRQALAACDRVQRGIAQRCGPLPRTDGKDHHRAGEAGRKLPGETFSIWLGSTRRLSASAVENLAAWAATERSAGRTYTLYVDSSSMFNNLEELTLLESRGVKIQVVNQGLFEGTPNARNNWNLFKAATTSFEGRTPAYNMASDVLRSTLLYKNGGAYIDVDIKPGTSSPFQNLELSAGDFPVLAPMVRDWKALEDYFPDAVDWARRLPPAELQRLGIDPHVVTRLGDVGLDYARDNAQAFQEAVDLVGKYQVQHGKFGNQLIAVQKGNEFLGKLLKQMPNPEDPVFQVKARRGDLAQDAASLTGPEKIERLRMELVASRTGEKPRWQTTLPALENVFKTPLQNIMTEMLPKVHLLTPESEQSIAARQTPVPPKKIDFANRRIEVITGKQHARQYGKRHVYVPVKKPGFLSSENMGNWAEGIKGSDLFSPGSEEDLQKFLSGGDNAARTAYINAFDDPARAREIAGEDGLVIKVDLNLLERNVVPFAGLVDRNPELAGRLAVIGKVPSAAITKVIPSDDTDYWAQRSAILSQLRLCTGNRQTRDLLCAQNETPEKTIEEYDLQNEPEVQNALPENQVGEAGGPSQDLQSGSGSRQKSDAWSSDLSAPGTLERSPHFKTNAPDLTDKEIDKLTWEKIREQFPVETVKSPFGDEMIRVVIIGPGVAVTDRANLANYHMGRAKQGLEWENKIEEERGALEELENTMKDLRHRKLAQDEKREGSWGDPVPETALQAAENDVMKQQRYLDQIYEARRADASNAESFFAESLLSDEDFAEYVQSALKMLKRWNGEAPGVPGEQSRKRVLELLGNPRIINPEKAGYHPGAINRMDLQNFPQTLLDKDGKTIAALLMAPLKSETSYLEAGSRKFVMREVDAGRGVGAPVTQAFNPRTAESGLGSGSVIQAGFNKFDVGQMAGTTYVSTQYNIWEHEMVHFIQYLFGVAGGDEPITLRIPKSWVERFRGSWLAAEAEQQGVVSGGEREQFYEVTAARDEFLAHGSPPELIAVFSADPENPLNLAQALDQRVQEVEQVWDDVKAKITDALTDARDQLKNAADTLEKIQLGERRGKPEVYQRRVEQLEPKVGELEIALAEFEARAENVREYLAVTEWHGGQVGKTGQKPFYDAPKDSTEIRETITVRKSDLKPILANQDKLAETILTRVEGEPNADEIQQMVNCGFRPKRSVGGQVCLFPADQEADREREPDQQRQGLQGGKAEGPAVRQAERTRHLEEFLKVPNIQKHKWMADRVSEALKKARTKKSMGDVKKYAASMDNLDDALDLYEVIIGFYDLYQEDSSIDKYFEHIWSLAPIYSQIRGFAAEAHRGDPVGIAYQGGMLAAYLASFKYGPQAGIAMTIAAQAFDEYNVRREGKEFLEWVPEVVKAFVENYQKVWRQAAADRIVAVKELTGREMKATDLMLRTSLETARQAEAYTVCKHLYPDMGEEDLSREAAKTEGDTPKCIADLQETNPSPDSEAGRLLKTAGQRIEKVRVKFQAIRDYFALNDLEATLEKRLETVRADLEQQWRENTGATEAALWSLNKVIYKRHKGIRTTVGRIKTSLNDWLTEFDMTKAEKKEWEKFKEDKATRPQVIQALEIIHKLPTALQKEGGRWKLPRHMTGAGTVVGSPFPQDSTAPRVEDPTNPGTLYDPSGSMQATEVPPALGTVALRYQRGESPGERPAGMPPLKEGEVVLQLPPDPVGYIFWGGARIPRADMRRCISPVYIRFTPKRVILSCFRDRYFEKDLTREFMRALQGTGLRGKRIEHIFTDPGPFASAPAPDKGPAHEAASEPHFTQRAYLVSDTTWVLIDLEKMTVLDEGTLDLPRHTGAPGSGRTDSRQTTPKTPTTQTTAAPPATSSTAAPTAAPGMQPHDLLSRAFKALPAGSKVRNISTQPIHHPGIIFFELEGGGFTRYDVRAGHLKATEVAPPKELKDVEGLQQTMSWMRGHLPHMLQKRTEVEGHEGDTWEQGVQKKKAAATVTPYNAAMAWMQHGKTPEDLFEQVLQRQSETTGQPTMSFGLRSEVPGAKMTLEGNGWDIHDIPVPANSVRALDEEPTAATVLSSTGSAEIQLTSGRLTSGVQCKLNAQAAEMECDFAIRTGHVLQVEFPDGIRKMYDAEGAQHGVKRYTEKTKAGPLGLTLLGTGADRSNYARVRPPIVLKNESSMPFSVTTEGFSDPQTGSSKIELKSRRTAVLRQQPTMSVMGPQGPIAIIRRIADGTYAIEGVRDSSVTLTLGHTPTHDEQSGSIIQHGQPVTFTPSKGSYGRYFPELNDTPLELSIRDLLPEPTTPTSNPNWPQPGGLNIPDNPWAHPHPADPGRAPKPETTTPDTAPSTTAPSTTTASTTVTSPSTAMREPTVANKPGPSSTAPPSTGYGSGGRLRILNDTRGSCFLLSSEDGRLTGHPIKPRDFVETNVSADAANPYAQRAAELYAEGKRLAYILRLDNGTYRISWLGSTEYNLALWAPGRTRQPVQSSSGLRFAYPLPGDTPLYSTEHLTIKVIRRTD